MRQTASLLFAAGASVVVLLEGLALASWQGWLPRKPVAQVRHAAAPAPRPPQPPQPAAPAVLQALPPTVQPGPAERPQHAYYRRLRAQLRWMPIRMHGQALLTPDPPSRMLLAKSAARRARLHEVGLGFADVYGLINAESSWAPRDGASRDGTPNLGIAQFEPATAAALGVRDPHDVVEAVHAAAELMREAAAWSAARIAGLRLPRKEREARLREGVSIYYNLTCPAAAASSGTAAAWRSCLRQRRRTSATPGGARRRRSRSRPGGARWPPGSVKAPRPCSPP